MKLYTIFVDNLPKGMSKTWLRQIFKNDGNVVDAFVSMKDRRNAKGRFGFVKFQRKEEAEYAISHNNGLDVKGHKMIVQWSRYGRNHAPVEKRTEKQHSRILHTKTWIPARRDNRSYKEVVEKGPTISLETVNENDAWLEEALICYPNMEMNVQEFKEKARREGITGLKVSKFDCSSFIVSKRMDGVIMKIEEESKEALLKFNRAIKAWSKSEIAKKALLH